MLHVLAIMKILLISPVIDLDKKTPKSLTIPQLALHLLAGLTPEEHEVQIVEEENELTDTSVDCDLVGISCMTSNVSRGYDLAKIFKGRGKSVVMGGIHPTVLPDEALLHADSVVIGEAEEVWETLLEDFQNGKLQKKYNKSMPVLDRYIPTRTRNDSKKRAFGAISVETTRGCPYTCDFCCVPEFYGRKMRHKQVDLVVKDIQESGSNKILFLDDNILGHPKYARELFPRLNPLNIKWAGQCSITTIEKNPDLLDLAVNSGCAFLYFGLETISPTTMKRLNKSMKSVEHMETTIKKIKDSGIHFHASIILGFDDDTEAVFPETLEFLNRNGIGTTTFHIMTPFPGTGLFNDMDKAGRILTKDWKHYHWDTVVFQPKNLTPDQLFEGFIWTKKEFSKFGNIVRRLPKNLSHPLLHVGLNIGAGIEVKHHQKKWKEGKFQSSLQLKTI